MADPVTHKNQQPQTRHSVTVDWNRDHSVTNPWKSLVPVMKDKS